MGPVVLGPGLHARRKLRSGSRRESLQTSAVFCDQMNDGDTVVLRLGKDEIYGVGTVEGRYEWCEAFGGIDGWDLQHVRSVRWFWKTAPDSPQRFPTYTLNLGDTTQRNRTNCKRLDQQFIANS
jgi:hypothetical protein